MRPNRPVSVFDRDGARRNNARCQKCFNSGHWTYECKNPEVYLSRPSRTEVLQNPKLQQKPLELDDAPAIPRITDWDYSRDPYLREEKRKRKQLEAELRDPSLGKRSCPYTNNSSPSTFLQKKTKHQRHGIRKHSTRDQDHALDDASVKSSSSSTTSSRSISRSRSTGSLGTTSSSTSKRSSSASSSSTSSSSTSSSSHSRVSRSVSSYSGSISSATSRSSTSFTSSGRSSSCRSSYHKLRSKRIQRSPLSRQGKSPSTRTLKRLTRDQAIRPQDTCTNHRKQTSRTTHVSLERPNTLGRHQKTQEGKHTTHKSQRKLSEETCQIQPHAKAPSRNNAAPRHGDTSFQGPPVS